MKIARSFREIPVSRLLPLFPELEKGGEDSIDIKYRKEQAGAESDLNGYWIAGFHSVMIVIQT